MNLETVQNENQKGYLEVGEPIKMKNYDGNGYLNDLRKHQNIFISSKINGTGNHQSISNMSLAKMKLMITDGLVQNIVHVVSLHRHYGIAFVLVLSEKGWDSLFSVEEGEDFLRIQQFRWPDLQENCMQL